MAIAEMTPGSFPGSETDAPVRVGTVDFDARDADLQQFKRGTRQLSEGSLLLQEGDEFGNVIIVLSGWLSTTKSLENGETQLIDFVLPGDILDPTTGDGRTAGLNVEATTDAVVSVLPLHRWHAMLKEFPRLERTVEHIQAAERARFSERILRLGKGSAQTRIAYALLEFCVRLAALGQATGPAFHVPLTQGHIGDFTGLSSVHVCRTMRRFVRNGIIETGDHMDIHITDLDALSEIAEIEADNLAREITPVSA